MKKFNILSRKALSSIISVLIGMSGVPFANVSAMFSGTSSSTQTTSSSSSSSSQTEQLIKKLLDAKGNETQINNTLNKLNEEELISILPELWEKFWNAYDDVCVLNNDTIKIDYSSNNLAYKLYCDVYSIFLNVPLILAKSDVKEAAGDVAFNAAWVAKENFSEHQKIYFTIQEFLNKCQGTICKSPLEFHENLNKYVTIAKELATKFMEIYKSSCNKNFANAWKSGGEAYNIIRYIHDKTYFKNLVQVLLNKINTLENILKK